jgi:hypothetical protein
MVVQRSLLLFCFQHIPTRAALHSEFSAFLTILPLPRGTPWTFNVRPFPLSAVIRPRLTSVKQDLHRCTLLLLRDSLRPPSIIYQISPGKNANFLSIYLSDLHPAISDSFGLRFVMQAHPQRNALSASYSSGQRFTAGFLQIPPREGHPCLKLTLPTIKARLGLSP